MRIFLYLSQNLTEYSNRMKSNYQLFRTLLLSTAIALGVQVWAVPAKPGLISVTDADGNELKVKLTGDEYFHQYLTEDGFPLIEENGNFYYCNFDDSGNPLNSKIKATNVSDRSVQATEFLATVDTRTLGMRIRKCAEKSPRRVFEKLTQSSRRAAKATTDLDGPPYERGYGLFPDLRFPAYGKQKSIVILVEYQDVKFRTSYKVNANDYFTRMLNETGFADYGATGSAAEYFKVQSNGAFEPEFDVYGPITLKNNMAYYGGNVGKSDKAPEEMVIEACEQLDDIVDFSEFDRNGDGVVDNIFIFYAGRGEASGGGANTVWPHSWSLTSAGHSNVYHDGVRIHTYGCTNEWTGSRPDGVGTFIHEFSHVMGLPDLYATDYTSSFTPDAWSTLDRGPYNNDGMTPPNYGAFERYALGWMKPREINKELSGTLPPVTDNVAGIIRTDRDEEFFLVENRQQEGWDKYIPGHGMLVWHVDYDDDIWYGNVVNNYPEHQYVDIEEADNIQSEYTRGGDAFPGTANKTSFTSATSPALRTWANKAINLPVTDIEEEAGMIKFNVLGGSDEVAPPAPEPQSDNVKAQSFTISWEPKDGYDALVSVYTKSVAEQQAPAKVIGDNREFVKGFRNRNVGSASTIEVTGVEPEMRYFYTVSYSQDWLVSEPSEEKSVETPRMTIDYYPVIAGDVEDVDMHSFTANWEPLEEATSYIIDVYKMVPGDSYVEETGFDLGVEDLGEWITTSTQTYQLSGYYGKEIPSLRLGEDQILETPDFDDFINKASFWHRGSSTANDCSIEVYALGGRTETLIKTIKVVQQEGGETSEITDIPEGTIALRIKFVRNSGKGVVAIDDFVVEHGTQYDRQPVRTELTNFNMGNVLSYPVTDLDHNTFYGFTVRASDGTLFSKPSEEKMVKTLFDPDAPGASVETVGSGSNGIEINGKTVVAHGEFIRVADYTGRVVATGFNAVELPGEGLYIVTIPSRNLARKIIVRFR